MLKLLKELFIAKSDTILHLLLFWHNASGLSAGSVRLRPGRGFRGAFGLVCGRIRGSRGGWRGRLVFGLGGLQIVLYALDGGVKVLLGEFAFPDGDDGPGEGVEALGVEFVAGDVAGDFLTPELFVGLGNGVLGATSVAVPEAAVDEDDGAVLGQDEVGGAGETFVIEPVPVALAPQCIPDGPLRGRVFGVDLRHYLVSLFRGHSVRHVTMALMAFLDQCCRLL